jgi:hypothetical protein
MLQTVVHRILWKSQHLKPYKLQVVQELTAYDKQLRSQFMAYMCPNCGTTNKPNRLRGLCPRANYTDRATTACQRSKCQLFADRGCHVVNAMDPYGRISGFLDRSRYFFFQAAPQLYSRGWMDPIPDPLKTKTKLHGLSPWANYTDPATACRRSDFQLFADRGCHVVSVTNSYGRILGFLDRSRYFSIK